MHSRIWVESRAHVAYGPGKLSPRLRKSDLEKRALEKRYCAISARLSRTALEGTQSGRQPFVIEGHEFNQTLPLTYSIRKGPAIFRPASRATLAGSTPSPPHHCFAPSEWQNLIWKSNYSPLTPLKSFVSRSVPSGRKKWETLLE